MTTRALAASVVCLIGLTALAQLRAQAPAAPSASIAGVVHTADDAARPVARVIVTATGSTVPAGRSSITDAEGRFSIAGLPAGRYVLSAKRPAYIPAVYGAARPGRTGVDIVLAEGQHVADVKIALVHGAAMSGLIRDANGQPLANAQITVQRQGPNGLTTSASGLSDDRGQYRVFGLAPGDYYVSALEYSLVQTVAGNMTAADVDAALERLRRARSGGPAPAPPPPVPTVNLAPVFYGGALSADQATPVRVAAGEDRGGIDITVMFARTATISGTVVLPAGVPASAATITLVPGTPIEGPRILMGPTGNLDSNGNFRFQGVNPGRYVLSAGVGNRSTPDTAPPPAKLWGQARIDVMGDDIPNVTVALRPYLHATGKVVADGGAAPDLSRTRVILGGGAYTTVNAAPFQVPPASVALGSPIAADGTFDTEFAPGAFTFVVAPLPAGWIVRSAIVDGRDALDVPVTVAPDANGMPPARITLTDRHTSISGTVQVAPGHSAADYFIVVFPADPALRQAGRRVKTLRAGADGRYRFADLPPGDYLIAALNDFLPEDLMDPSFFPSIQASALALKLGDGESKNQDFRIGG